MAASKSRAIPIHRIAMRLIPFYCCSTGAKGIEVGGVKNGESHCTRAESKMLGSIVYTDLMTTVKVTITWWSAHPVPTWTRVSKLHRIDF